MPAGSALPARELVERFAARCRPEDTEAFARRAEEVARDFAGEPHEAQAARLLVRARDLLAERGLPFATDPLAAPRSPRLDIEWRLDLARELGAGAPPNFAESTPTAFFDRELDRPLVIELWRALLDARAAGTAPPLLQLYAHVPFCRTRCGFCQCSSVVATRPSEVGEYLAALVDEAEAFQSLGRIRVDAVTVGGGTPSHLTAAELESVLAAVMRVGSIEPDTYFSVEFNPDSTTRDKLRVLAGHGVNRLSLGIQSFHGPTLHAVARGYQTTDLVRQAVSLARELPMQLSVDLLAPLAEETEESFVSGVREALSLEPDQIVLYPYQVVHRGMRTMAPGDLPFAVAATRFLDLAERRGYLRRSGTGSSIVVERPGTRGYDVRYIQHAHEPGSLLALGPYAESHVFGETSYVSVPDPDGRIRYVGQRCDLDAERASFLGRRLASGQSFSASSFRTVFGAPVETAHPAAWAYLEERGVFAREGDLVHVRARDAEEGRALAFLVADRARLRQLHELCRAPGDADRVWLDATGAFEVESASQVVCTPDPELSREDCLLAYLDELCALGELPPSLARLLARLEASGAVTLERRFCTSPGAAPPATLIARLVAPCRELGRWLCRALEIADRPRSAVQDERVAGAVIRLAPGSAPAIDLFWSFRAAAVRERLRAWIPGPSRPLLDRARTVLHHAPLAGGIGSYELGGLGGDRFDLASLLGAVPALERSADAARASLADVLERASVDAVVLRAERNPAVLRAALRIHPPRHALPLATRA